MNYLKLKRLLITLAAFSLFGVVCVFSGVAQHWEKPALSFEPLEQDLLSNNVSSIYQDTYGYIWIGTFSGLQRYDGLTMYYYTGDENPESLDNSFVQEIFEDRDDELWIRTITGMCRYNRKTDTFINYEIPLNPHSDHKTKSITVDNNGKLWVIGGEEGLFGFDPENQKLSVEYDFTDITLTSITTGRDNELWISSRGHGLFQFNTETGTVEKVYTHNSDDPNSIASDVINVIETDPDGGIWIGTNSNGLDQMVISEEKTIFKHHQHEPHNPNSLRNNDIYALHIDRRGRLWVGNENGGLHLYNRENDNFYSYQHNPEDPNSLSSNSVYSILDDRDGRLWVGTGLNGVAIADPYISKFKHYQVSATKDNWLTNNTIRDFFETENGNIWIATDGGGLNYFDQAENTFSAYTHNPDDPTSLKSNAILDIEKDDSGRIWVGTWGGGINILMDEKQGKFISFKEMIGNQEYPIQNVFDIHFDTEYDYVWIGTYREGLYRYERNKNELRNFTNLSSTKIQHLFEDSEGNIWISTEFGLNLLKAEDKHEGMISNYTANESDTSSLPGDLVYQVFEDSKSNIWVATSYGLARFNKEKNNFTNFYEFDGLPSNDIRSVIEDETGNLWIGTLNGISKFSPEAETFTNYNRSDGLQGNEFSRHTVKKLSTGEVLFGGMNGFNIFHPDRLQNNPHQPPVYLTDFRLFNQSVEINNPESPLEQHISVTESLVLSHAHTVFTFEFVALNYSKSHQNEYAYKLEGFEEDWNYVGTQRNATYTSLPPGNYTFRVKAANNDGVWNEEGAALALIITPPFWQTIWFYLFGLLFIGGAIIGVYNYRVRQIRAQNKHLEQEVSSRTSELHKKNNALEEALDELKATRAELIENAHKAGMADIATGMLHNIGNVLNSITTSTSITAEVLKHTKLEKLFNANKLLKENKDDLAHFFTADPKGIKLVEYYLKLEDSIKKELELIRSHNQRLDQKAAMISNVIAAQQNYATVGLNSENYTLEEVIGDSLTIFSASIERHNIKIEKAIEATDPVRFQKTKLVHVLLNLFKNAKEATEGVRALDKIISIKLHQQEDEVFLEISDNGHGIKKENMDKVFTHGFTTKSDGHGFGLHSSANYLTEMGAKIQVKSENDGENCGATFKIIFPVAKGDKKVTVDNMETDE